MADLHHITSIKQSYKIFETVKRRWSLETHHQLKDNILEEDSLRYTDKTIANNIAIINNFVINFIKLVKEVTKAPSVKAAAKYVRINFFGAFETVIKAYGKQRLIRDTSKEILKKEMK